MLAPRLGNEKGTFHFARSTSLIKSALEEKSIGTQENDTNPFVAGFLLNFVHPVNLIYWVTILGSILVKDIQETSFLTAYLDGMGIPLGVFGWWLALSSLTSFARQWITPRIMQHVSMGSSLLLLGFAFWFFFNAFSL
ncbi:MAG: LysE family transporter [Candidatus Yonathbacteria bacterium]|nr:LysE family transporter [Candidatus Yonathbacteria bacterium]